MAKKHTAPAKAQSALLPPDPREELHEALYGLSCAISLMKVATAAPVNRLDPAQHTQAMKLVIGKLDEAYDAMDLAIVHASRGPTSSAAVAAEAQS